MAVPPICPVISLPLVAAVDAIGWRLRGSDEFKAWHGRGATTSRLLTSATTAAGAWLFCDLAPINAAWLAAALFVGCLLSWPATLDMSGWRDVLVHSTVCLGRVLPAALLLWWIGGLWWPLLVAGALGGPAYRLAGSTERGELAWGALRGAAIAGGITWAF